MGYTHYWSNPGIPTELWSAFRSDVTRILDQYQNMEPDYPLAGPRGQGAPEVTVERIALNGQEPLDHEPFIITPAAGWEFCKTNWKPYDVVVCAALLRAALTIPGLDIDSDGGWEEPPWAAARALYEGVFGENPTAVPFRDTTSDEDIADEE